MVIVFEDGAKRNSWKMAVIEELVHRRDNKVRGANVRVVTKGKTLCLSRPLQKLHPIEVEGTRREAGTMRKNVAKALLLAELWPGKCEK